MDKELPWLADNAQLELKYKKGKTPLSHRNWPGEPVPVITESIIQTLGDELLQKAEKKKNIVWRYENFLLEWQSAITQAINLIGEHKPSIPARTMAALACIAQNDSQQLLDEIVQQEGLEYATDVVMARQCIARRYESDSLVVTLQYQDEDYGYGYGSATYNDFALRLRKHLSLAEESCWQRCADKLIAALPGIPKIRRPFIALILPEKPEIANELASLESSRSSLHSKEWLKVVATDNTAVKKLERYWGLDVFSDREASYMSQKNHFGYAACAALLREQGLAAIPRLAMYAHKEDCGSLLVQINHPQVIHTLLLVADKNKPSLQRVAKYSKNFPHATLAALAELLALKEPPARPGYPIIEDKKLPAQQKARDEYWRTLLQTLMASQPQLAEEVMQWLSTQARAVPSLPAARAFILGDSAQNISRKVVISPSAVERMLVTLATGRGLMLVGEPGTAKSLLSELLATAISGDAGLTVQGGASTTEDQIKYGWNYALLINHGPSTEALVPAPLYQGMRDGKIVRFEEITRTPLEVQDCLLGMLSDRVMTVPELTGEASQLYAREGFNIIATANTRDRGVNEMSAALKRRFDFETVFPIMDFAQELELVASASARLLAHSGIPHKVPDAVLELLVRTFRDLRANGEKKTSMDTLTAIMSTAEAVNVAHAVGVRAWFLANRAGEPADLVDCIAGTIVKDNEEDRARLRRYFEQRVATHKEAHWQAYYQARHRLP